MEPKFSSQPINNEKQKLSKVIEKLVDRSEVELFCQFLMTKWWTTTWGRVIFTLNRTLHMTSTRSYTIYSDYGILVVHCMAITNFPERTCIGKMQKTAVQHLYPVQWVAKHYSDIERNLHLCDNTTLNQTDKLFKMYRYTDLLNVNYAQFEVFAHSLSIDEQMFPDVGRLKCKMFMQWKNVRFGLKICFLRWSDGYLFNSLPYVEINDSFDSYIGLGGGVKMHLLSIVFNPLQHTSCFDNSMSSHKLTKLMIKLRSKQFHAIRTTRESRLVDVCCIIARYFRRKSGGAYDFSFDRHNEILAVKWHEHAVVTLFSYFQSV